MKLNKIKLMTIAMLLSFSTLLFAAVNINTATQAELSELNGVGDAKAAAIIKHREENGPFKTIDGLTAVGGIGEATLEKNRDNLSVGKQK